MVAFITSRIDPAPSTTDILFDPSQPDFAVTGLKVASTLQLHQGYYCFGEPYSS